MKKNPVTDFPLVDEPTERCLDDLINSIGRVTHAIDFLVSVLSGNPELIDHDSEGLSWILSKVSDDIKAAIEQAGEVQL